MSMDLELGIYAENSQRKTNSSPCNHFYLGRADTSLTVNMISPLEIHKITKVSVISLALPNQHPQALNLKNRPHSPAHR